MSETMGWDLSGMPLSNFGASQYEENDVAIVQKDEEKIMFWNYFGQNFITNVNRPFIAPARSRPP